MKILLSILLFILVIISSSYSIRINIQNKSLDFFEKLKNGNFAKKTEQVIQENKQKYKKHFLRRFDQESNLTLVADKLIELKLSSDFGNSYEGVIELGEQQTKLSALFDTGSSVIWFASKSCSQCVKSGITQEFDCDSSKTCVKTSKKDKIKYGKGECSGIVIQDDLSINGQVTIKNQDVLLIDKIKDFPNYPGDGLIGLGSEKLTSGETTLMQNLFEQKLIEKNLFAMVIRTQGDSFLDLGSLNQDLYEGHIYYFPILNNGYWAIKMTKLFMKFSDGVSLAIQKDDKPNYWQLKGQALVIDSGTSILTFPSSDVDALIVMLNQKGFNCQFDTDKYQQILCDIPTDDSLEFPDLGVNAIADSGQNISLLIDPSQYIICDNTFLYKCVLRVSKLDIRDIAIFGDVFMQSFYNIFDIQYQRIGFAQLNQNYQGNVQKNIQNNIQQDIQQNYEFIQQQ